MNCGDTVRALELQRLYPPLGCCNIDEGMAAEGYRAVLSHFTLLYDTLEVEKAKAAEDRLAAMPAGGEKGLQHQQKQKRQRNQGSKG